MAADRDPPVLELALVAVYGAQLHHHLVSVELDHDVDAVLRLQSQPAVTGTKSHRLAIELRQRLVDREVVERRSLGFIEGDDRRVGASANPDVVGMAVTAVRSPTHDRAWSQLHDLLGDALRDLRVVSRGNASVGVVPKLDAVDRQRGRGFLELFGADLGQVLLLGPRRLAGPPGFAVRRTDQICGNAGPRVAQDEAAAAHRLVVGMRHHEEQASLLPVHELTRVCGLPSPTRGRARAMQCAALRMARATSPPGRNRESQR